MSTSGSVNFAVNRDELIKDSLIDCGAIAQEDTPSDSIINHAARKLNMMLKAWQADGLQLWKIREFTVLLEKDKQSYNLGATGDNATESFTKTEIATAASTSDTSIVVASTSGMGVSDYVGIVLDDGTIQWTTVKSITNTTTFVVVTAITGAAAIDKNVYYYTTKITRPLAIVDVFHRDDSDNDRPVRIISREEYRRLGSKDSSGSVVEVYFDPQLTNAVLYVYNPANVVTDKLNLVGQFSIEDMDTANDDFDFPQEWYLAIQSNLALLLAPSYGVRAEQRKVLADIAVTEKQRVMGWDKEMASMYIQPERTR